MHYQDQERARNMARLGALAGTDAMPQREMSPEERAEYERRERQEALRGAVHVNYNLVISYAPEEDLLELQKTLKAMATRVIDRQPG